MNCNIEITPGLYYVGANDYRTQKFEALWTLPHGVSYNSYLMVDEKVALIDTIEAKYTETFLTNIRNILGSRGIDYLIINHMEPDHSASIAAVRRAYPDVQIVGNPKTIDMINGFYGICHNMLVVKEGDTLHLGEKDLTFYPIPMVHWPETMATYCPQEKILFSGDAFGCFGALVGGVIDEDICCDIYWDEMYRYYASIVGKYGVPVQNALKKLAPLPIDIICTTHGPVWEKYTKKVIDIYDRLSRHESEMGVVIVYGSMYGNTARMAEEIARAIGSQGIDKVVLYDISTVDKSVVLRDIFRYNSLIIGSATYNTGLFPDIEALLSALRNREVKSKVYGCFGSFSWAGRAVKELTAFGNDMHWAMPGAPVEMRQGFSDAIIGQCRELAKSIAAKLKKC